MITVKISVSLNHSLYIHNDVRVRVISSGNYNIYIHCSNGKDGPH